MRVKGLDGREYPWNLRGLQPARDDARARSSYHLAARQLLQRLFPTTPILEEVPLPGSDGLRADFYLPMEKLIVEVHGEQHYKYVPHFHGDRLGFLAAKRRDASKETWCDLNGLRFVALPYSEDIDEWRSRVTS